MRKAVKNLFKLNVRCMLLQACWNFRVFQGMGSFWIYQPFHQNVCNQELIYFNTNTFCAPSILAAQMSLREKQTQGEHVVIGADDFVVAVMAPVAAVGDALFWGGLRPMAALVAVIATLLGYWWAPLTVILIFTLPTIMVRIGGSIVGYARGAQVVALIQQLHLADLAVKIKQVNVVLLGVVAALTWRGVGSALDLGGNYLIALAAAFIIIFGANVFFLRRKVPVVVLFGLALVIFSTLELCNIAA